jgi:23S rRNA pseudouridine1911/1915/1917 synthase
MWPLPPPSCFTRSAVKEDPKIVYYDNHLLVLDKPSGMLTQPNDSDEISLEAWGKAWLKEKFEKKGNVFLEATHRLDRPASGLVLFARTTKALTRLQESIRNKEWSKKYIAIVEGVMQMDSGKFEDLLHHEDHRARVGSGGKESVLFFKTIERGSETTLVEIDLVTGRYHQIRVQFASRKLPLFGDRKYGAKKAFPSEPERIALHHSQLTVSHPITHEKIVFESNGFRDFNICF